jgi:nucleosome binding factor SPN SPT16 subunit
MDELEQEEQER